jgi:hypothetical protein
MPVIHQLLMHAEFCSFVVAHNQSYTKTYNRKMQQLYQYSFKKMESHDLDMYFWTIFIC